MKTKFRVGIVLAVLPLLLAACGGVPDSTPKQLTVVNHWGGNTGGKGGQPQFGGDAISNFVVDIAVLKQGQLAEWFNGEIQALAPLVITKSYWDETGMADGVYSNGMRVGKGDVFNTAHPGGWPGTSYGTSTSAANGITATIVRPHVLDTNHDIEKEILTAQQIKDFGQQGAEAQGLPLADYADNLPHVQLSNGQTIKSVPYPTGVAFDNSGRLWVADNGPDQNFKIFNVPASGAPTPATPQTFGEVGGVFAGPVKGRTGEKRFWGPRGVGFGDAGEIIVGTSGIPGQVQGGTDIRAFNSAKEWMWEVKGLFMHSPDVDPSSNGTSIYTAAQRFEMDYSKDPGKSWRQAAVTLDPFRFPNDIRVRTANEIAFVRVVNGKKFLFVSDMYGLKVAVFRFEANSEIAVPAAIFGIASNERGAAWTLGKQPPWENEEIWDANKNRRQAWRDNNGDGLVDADEIFSVQMPFPYTQGIDVDDNGNIWVAGRFNSHNSEIREGGNLLIPFATVDGNGVPFNGSEPRFVDVPSELILPGERDQSSGHIRYLAASDTIIMATGNYYSPALYVIDGYLKSGHPKLRFRLDLGYDDQNCQCSPDILRNDTTKMVLPNVYAADADYLYVGYIDNGPDAKVRGEITVYSLVDGHKVGWIVPSAETNHYAGNFDMRHGIQVRKLYDGTRIIVAEENGAGKFMVYRWKP